MIPGARLRLFPTAFEAVRVPHAAMLPQPGPRIGGTSGSLTIGSFQLGTPYSWGFPKVRVPPGIIHL